MKLFSSAASEGLLKTCILIMLLFVSGCAVSDIKNGNPNSEFTDSHTKLQGLIDAAFVSGAGREVILSPGRYIISKPLLMPRNVYLTGSGKGFNTVIEARGEAAIWISGETQPGGYAFRNVISKLLIDMGNAPTKSVAIKISKAYSINVEDVFIYQAQNKGIEVQKVKHLTLEDVSIYGLDNSTGIGLDIFDGIANFYNVDIENVLHGVRLRDSSPLESKVSFFGLYLERFGAVGITFDESENSLISGAFISAPGKHQIPLIFKDDPNSEECACNNTVISSSFVSSRGFHKNFPFLNEGQDNHFIGNYVQKLKGEK